LRHFGGEEIVLLHDTAQRGPTGVLSGRPFLLMCFETREVQVNLMLSKSAKPSFGTSEIIERKKRKINKLIKKEIICLCLRNKQL
jgi:hypothetical protein